MPQWVKGQSGNPAGRARIDKSMQLVAREHGADMLAILVRLAKSRKTPHAVRARCAEAVLDRGYGRPPSFTTSDAEAFRDAREMSDDELRAAIADAVRELELESQAKAGEVRKRAAAAGNGKAKPH